MYIIQFILDILYLELCPSKKWDDQLEEFQNSYRYLRIMIRTFAVFLLIPRDFKASSIITTVFLYFMIDLIYSIFKWSGDLFLNIPENKTCPATFLVEVPYNLYRTFTGFFTTKSQT